MSVKDLSIKKKQKQKNNKKTATIVDFSKLSEIFNLKIMQIALTDLHKMYI